MDDLTNEFAFDMVYDWCEEVRPEHDAPPSPELVASTRSALAFATRNMTDDELTDKIKSIMNRWHQSKWYEQEIETRERRQYEQSLEYRFRFFVAAMMQFFTQ